MIAKNSTVSLAYSVVVPVRNEAGNIASLIAEISAVMAGLDAAYEIIYVDDGSTDGTFEILSRLHAADPRLRVIQLRRNFGQTAAFAAGFARARGRIIVTADGDLQNDLRDIPRMVDKLEEGYDIVCGWRKARKDRWLSRRRSPRSPRRHSPSRPEFLPH